MKALFKNTPMSAFTPERQKALSILADEVSAFADAQWPGESLPYLSDVLLKHAVINQKYTHFQPIHKGIGSSFDIMACLHWDGMDIDAYYKYTASSFHPTLVSRQDNFANIETKKEDYIFQAMMENGLPGIATMCSGLIDEYKFKAISDLSSLAILADDDWPSEQWSGIKSLNIDHFDFLNRISMVRCLLDVSEIITKSDDPFEQRALSMFELMPVNTRITDEMESKLSTAFEATVKFLRDLTSEIGLNEWLCDDMTRLFVYNYGVAMKVNGMAHEDIIYNSGIVINSVLKEFHVQDNNKDICKRSLQINMLSPFPENLRLMKVANEELQGVYSDEVNSSLIEHEMLISSHLMGPAIALQKHISARWNLFSGTINHLNRSGYNVCFDIAINGIMEKRQEIVDLLELEGGYSPMLEKQIASREVSFDRLDRFLFRLDSNKLSKEVVLSAIIMLFDNMLNKKDSPPKVGNEKLRDAIRSRQYKHYIRDSYKRIDSLREDVFCALQQEEVLNLDAFKFFGFDEIEMRKMGKDVTREIQRFVLSNDLNL